MDRQAPLALQEFIDPFLQSLLEKISYETKNVILSSYFNPIRPGF